MTKQIRQTGKGFSNPQLPPPPNYLKHILILCLFVKAAACVLWWYFSKEINFQGVKTTTASWPENKSLQGETEEEVFQMKCQEKEVIICIWTFAVFSCCPVAHVLFWKGVVSQGIKRIVFVSTECQRDASRHGKNTQDSVKVTWHSRSSFSLQLEDQTLFTSNEN